MTEHTCKSTYCESCSAEAHRPQGGPPGAVLHVGRAPGRRCSRQTQAEQPSTSEPHHLHVYIRTYIHVHVHDTHYFSKLISIREQNHALFRILAVHVVNFELCSNTELRELH